MHDDEGTLISELLTITALLGGKMERTEVYERGLHVDIDHAHIDDIGEIHGDVVTHPKQF